MLLALHVHSKFSFDSLAPVEKIVSLALRGGIGAVAITDHDTMEGSLQAASIAAGTSLQIIPGAEYFTDCGDIIGLFLSREVKSRHAAEVVREIRDQGGLSILPHPYHGHSKIEEIAAMVDVIEVFNGRCSAAQNEAAAALATRLQKPVTAGSDAHFTREMTNTIMNFECESPLTPDTFLQAPRTWSARPNRPASYQFSQMIKALKQRDLRLFRGQFRPLAKHALSAALRWF